MADAADDPTGGFLTAKRFHAVPGVEDWRVLYLGPHAHYRCADLQVAARFGTAVAAAAALTGVSPDIDLRPHDVTIRIRSAQFGRISEPELDLARRVSVAAHTLRLVPDPSQVQVVQIAVAADPGVHVRPFWIAALGYEPIGDEDAVDPQWRNPPLWFHPVEPPKPGRGRTHIDVCVPADQAEARVAAALAAGGRLADDSHAPDWWTLASPDNHGVDIAAWPDTNDD